MARAPDEVDKAHKLHKPFAHEPKFSPSVTSLGLGSFRLFGWLVGYVFLTFIIMGLLSPIKTAEEVFRMAVTSQKDGAKSEAPLGTGTAQKFSSEGKYLQK